MSPTTAWARLVSEPVRTEITSPDDLHDLVQRGYRFALALTHDQTQAEDLVQDAWLGVLRVGGSWSAPYLFTTIRNRFIDQCRRNRLVAFEPITESHDHLATESTDVWPAESPFDIETGELAAALERLSPVARAAIYLSAVEGYTAREIAELLGKPRGTILSAMHRGRAQLRKLLNAESGVEP